MEYGKDYFGFVYVWYNSKNFRMSKNGTKEHPWLYVGSHMGSEHDPYISSQPKLNEAYRKNRNNFKRKIVYWHPTESRQELYNKENEWLSLIEKEELRVRFYNGTKNAFGPEGCDLKRLWKDPEFRAKQDATWTPDRREQQRQDQLASWTDERKESWSSYQKELWDNPLHREKMRLALASHYANTQVHEAHSKLMSEKWATDSAYREKLQKQRKDPEYRAKLSKALTNIPRKKPERRECPNCSKTFLPGPFSKHTKSCKL